jgi:hypothetical protein
MSKERRMFIAKETLDAFNDIMARSPPPLNEM